MLFSFMEALASVWSASIKLLALSAKAARASAATLLRKAPASSAVSMVMATIWAALMAA